VGPSTTTSARAASLATAALVGGTLLGLLVIGQRLWFASDEWNIMTEYPSGNLLVPFNGHLSAVPVALYQLLFHSTGVVDHLPYRVLGIAAIGLLAAAVAVYVRSRIGAWTALLVVAGVLWNSFGSTNLLFPFLLNFSLPMAMLVVIWWLLDREDQRSDIGAAVALALALACSGLGLVALVAVAAELAVARIPWRRWLVILAPGTVLWFLWWITHGESGTTSTDVPRVAAYAARMLLGGTTAIAGGWGPGGGILLLALAGLVVVSLLRWRESSFRNSARIAGAVAAPAAFVLLTAASRIDTVPAIPPDELRYGWTVGALLLLAAVACWRPTTADRSSLATLAIPAWVIGAFIVTASGVVLVGDLQRWVDEVAANTPGVRTNLYSAEVVGAARIDPDIVMPLSFVPVTTGRYLTAVAELGSPIESTAEEEFGGRADQLEVADRIVAESVPVNVESGRPAGAMPDSPCPAELVAQPGAAVHFDSGLSASSVTLRRFGDGALNRVDLPLGRSVLRLPLDAPVPVDFVIPYRIVAPPDVRCAVS